MARRDRLGLTAVRTEGAILPPSILARIHREDMTLGGLKAEDYGLSGTKLREAASQAWNSLQGPWRAFQGERANLAPGEAATAMTRRRWLDQVLKALDYGVLEPLRESLRVSDRDFPISHRYKTVPIHLVGSGLDLDKRTKGAVGAATSSPHGLVQLYLNADDKALWGFVSNGLRWRVLRDSVSLSRQAMVEFDLEAIFEGQLYDEFLLYFLVCHQSRLQTDRPEDYWLEKWSQAAADEGKRALTTLRRGVEKAIEALGQGFLRHPDNQALRERIRQGSLDKQDYYRQLLRMVYRLLFLFVAEDRGLLLHPKAAETTKRVYTESYGTQRLRMLAERLRGSRRHHDLFVQLKLVIGFLGEPEGCPALGLPALGGFLFTKGSCPDLDAAELANADLLDAIRCLAVTEEDGRRTRVDYKNLASEEMGSVYESLLELYPDLRSDGSEFKLLSASGNERKTTGSYYTPDSLIQCLLDTALEPVVADAVKRAGGDTKSREDAILDLRVIDPAVGSGHFLIAAAHRLAKRLAQVRSGDDEPSPEATRHALRDVIGRCLYGIDMNPMAAELCKVALWMEALEPGKPLSFLDHHIVVGNSLLGTTPELIAKGIPDAAFDAIEGDDKELCKTLKKRNKVERESQGDLFDQEAFAGKNLLDAWRELDSLRDETLAEVQAKERAHRKAESAIAMRKRIADAWCAAFVIAKAPSAPDGSAGQTLTTGVLRQLATGAALSPELESLVQGAASKFRFLHPHLAFPEVFTKGGFDVVLGNPPWERVKLQEKEFFAERSPQVAQARNKAEREQLIRQLEGTSLHQEFLEAKREAEATSAFLRKSDRFPLAGRGDVNTFAVFAELKRSLLGPFGRAGIIVPTGIATDDTTKHFFSDLMEKRVLCSLYDFENGNRDSEELEEAEDQAIPSQRATSKGRERGDARVFPGVHRQFKFCLLTITGTRISETQPQFAFFCHRVSDLAQSGKMFILTTEDVAVVNPNSRTCPIFRDEADAQLGLAIHRRNPVLMRSETPESNQWGLRLFRLFDMATDSGLFATNGAQSSEAIPLYEAKMIHQFDHRWASFSPESGDFSDVEDLEKTDPGFRAVPQYWVDRQALMDRLGRSLMRWRDGDDHDRIIAHRMATGPSWWLGWRDITNATNQRTAIFAIFPPYSANHKLMLCLTAEPPPLEACLLATANSFVFDWCVRQKLGGTDLTFSYLSQIPAPTPDVFRSVEGLGGECIGQWVARRVVALTFTNHETEAFARACGYQGEVYRWDIPERRAIRAQLDACIARLYGVSREELARILASFPIVRRREIAQYSTYRMASEVLDNFDALEVGGTPVSTLELAGIDDAEYVWPSLRRQDPPAEGGLGL